MVPRAKKNLHEAQFHLSLMEKASHFEELEIAFAAFVNSSRNITFVLNKEFKKHPMLGKNFLDWYGDGDDPQIGSKAYELKNDPLCAFFVTVRNAIGKEGINGLACSTEVRSLNTGTDLIDQPAGSSFLITNQGMYFLVHEGSGKEDLIPARTKGSISTIVSMVTPPPPETHKGEKIVKNDILTLSRMYLKYLASLVEEWTEMINKS